MEATPPEVQRAPPTPSTHPKEPGPQQEQPAAYPRQPPRSVTLTALPPVYTEPQIGQKQEQRTFNRLRKTPEKGADSFADVTAAVFSTHRPFSRWSASLSVRMKVMSWCQRSGPQTVRNHSCLTLLATPKVEVKKRAEQIKERS